MDKRVRCGFIFIGLFCLLIIGSPAGFANSRPCCPDDPEVSYLLSPKSTQKFQYRVQYETFFSSMLGQRERLFHHFPEGFDQEAKGGYPVLFLLHGYNFHRNGVWWKVTSPEKAKKILCEVKEEEYHWLLHEDIAVIAYALMDPEEPNLSGSGEVSKRAF